MSLLASDARRKPFNLAENWFKFHLLNKICTLQKTKFTVIQKFCKLADIHHSIYGQIYGPNSKDGIFLA